MYSWQDEFGDVLNNVQVLVTGATGFIGGHLCQALSALGAQVYALDIHDRVCCNTYGARGWMVDLSDYEATRSALLDIRPVLMYHLAGLVTANRDVELVRPMLQNNLVSTVNLLTVAHDIGCKRIVVTGSAEEPGVGGADSIPSSPYAAAKAAGTLYCQMFHRLYDLPVVILRPFVCYGPRQAPTKLIPYTILSLLRDQSPRLSSGERVCDFVYVLDLIRGFLRAGLQPGLEGRIIELGTGQGTKIRQVVDRLADLVVEGKAQPQFGGIADRSGEHPVIANLEQTQRLLDWKPLWPLQKGLEETVQWYRESTSISV
jgi:nucleoside-diphosphate-sugar epimerase